MGCGASKFGSDSIEEIANLNRIYPQTQSREDSAVHQEKTRSAFKLQISDSKNQKTFPRTAIQIMESSPTNPQSGQSNALNVEPEEVSDSESANSPETSGQDESPQFEHTSSDATPARRPQTAAQNPIDQIRKLIELIPLFRSISDKAFLSSLAEGMSARVCTAGEVIVKRGEDGRAMFFTMRGEVEVISDDGETVYDVIPENSFFGEVGLLFSVPRTATVRAGNSRKGASGSAEETGGANQTASSNRPVSQPVASSSTVRKSMLLILTKDKFLEILREYPQVAEQIRLEADERFSLFKKREEEGMKVGIEEEGKLDITGKDLGKIPLFRKCDMEFLHKLALRLQPKRFKFHEFVVRADELANSMYFVVSGTAEVLFPRQVHGDPTEEPFTKVAELRPGSFFGEIGLLFAKRRTASVRSTTEQLDCFILTKEDLDGVLKAYPDVAAVIAEEAEERLILTETRRKIEQESHSQALTANIDDATHDVELEITREKLKQVSLFQQCDMGFLHLLAMRMRYQLFGPLESIIRKGDVGSDCFFIASGTAQIYADPMQDFAETPSTDPQNPPVPRANNQENIVIYAELGAGSYFGEVSLFYDVRRTASARASKDGCALYILSKKDLQKVLREYPDIEERMNREGMNNMERYRQRREAVKKVADEVTKAEMISAPAAKDESSTPKTALVTRKPSMQFDAEKFEIEATTESLKKLPFFKNIDVKLLREIAVSTEVRSYPSFNTKATTALPNAEAKRGDPHFFFQKGEASREMFIIVNGEAEVISGDKDDVVATLTSGQFFGEVGLRYGVPRTASVRVALQKPSESSEDKSVRRCDVFVLTAEALRKVLSNQNFTEITSMIEVEASDRFRRARLRESVEKGSPYSPPPPLPSSIPPLTPSSTPPQSTETRNQSESSQLSAIASAETLSFADKNVDASANAVAPIPKSASSANIPAVGKEGDKPNTKIATAVSPASNDSSSQPEIAMSENDLKVKKDGKANPLSQIFKNIGKLFKPKKSKRDKVQSSLPEMRSHASSTKETTHPRRQSSIVSSASSHKDDILGAPRPTDSFYAQFLQSSLPSRLQQKLISVHKKYVKSFDDPEKAMQSVKHILEMDPSIMDHLFFHFEPLSKLRAASCCKAWRAIILGVAQDAMTESTALATKQLLRRDRLWKMVSFEKVGKHFSPRMLSGFLTSVAPIIKNVTTLNLSNCWQLEDEDINCLTKNCPHIVALLLSDCWKLTDAAVCSIGSNGVSQLKNIDLSHCGKITGNTTGPPPLGSTPVASKKSVVRGGGGTSNVFTMPAFRLLGVGCPALEIVHVAYCKQITADPIEALVSHCPEIRNIRLTRCRLPDTAILAIVRYCPMLTMLDLSDCDQITDRSLQYIASGCPRLTDLSLSFCCKITDNGIVFLATSFGASYTTAHPSSNTSNAVGNNTQQVTQKISRSLNSLDLTACGLITDLSITKFNSNALRQLRCLSLRLCKNITDVSIKHIANGAVMLRHLDVRQCQQVDLTATRQYFASRKNLNLLHDTPALPSKTTKPRAIEIPRKDGQAPEAVSHPKKKKANMMD